MSKKEKKYNNQAEEIHLEIPEEDIWTYQVEGLAAPKIGKTPSHYTLKKVIFALVIVVAVSLSCIFSVLALRKDTFEYEQTSTGYEFTRFSNTGFIDEITIDYVLEVEYEMGNPDPKTNFKIVRDETKPITSVGSYVLNCDEKVKIITIGAGVEKVDSKAFYSCWALREIRVDENNPNYCDVDGVLYNKDKTELICRPCDHDTYLAEKYGYAKYDNNGWRIEPSEGDTQFRQRYYYRNVVKADEGFADVNAVEEYFNNNENQKALEEFFKETEEGFFEKIVSKIKGLFSKNDGQENKPLTNSEKYNKFFENEENYKVYIERYFMPYYEPYERDVLTYVVPSSVEVIGEMAFNYSNMKTVYLPEGLKTIETLGFFEIPLLENVYSYKGAEVTDPHFTSEEALGEVYISLPEGLEYIGSDAFSYNRALTYVYIPESVTFIGHHAFWDTVYKEDGELKGITVINVARSKEDLKASVEIGTNWRPQYDFLLFKKSIDVAYSQSRQAK